MLVDGVTQRDSLRLLRLRIYPRREGLRFYLKLANLPFNSAQFEQPPSLSRVFAQAVPLAFIARDVVAAFDTDRMTGFRKEYGMGLQEILVVIRTEIFPAAIGDANIFVKSGVLSVSV